MTDSVTRPGPFGPVNEIVGDWIDATSGLRCVVLVGPMLSLNGYVAVRDDHPWFGKGYSEHLAIPCAENEKEDGYCYSHSPEAFLDVHGGITYAGNGLPMSGEDDGQWWFGFDTAHAGDHVPALDDYRLGTSLRERGVLRAPEWMGAECTSLAHQLAAVALGHGGKGDSDE